VHRLKGEPKQPTTQNNREFLDHLAWLKEQSIGPSIFRGIPDVKLKQFAAEARSLDVTSMNDLTDTKRLALAATLVFAQDGPGIGRCCGYVCAARASVAQSSSHRPVGVSAEHVERTDSLVETLHGVTLAYRTEGSAEQRYPPWGIHRTQLRPHPGAVRGPSGNCWRNYSPFSLGSTPITSGLFSFLESVELLSTSPDKR